MIVMTRLFLLPENNDDFVTVHDLQELLVVEFPVSVSIASADDSGHRFVRQLFTQLAHSVLQLTSWNGETNLNPLKTSKTEGLQTPSAIEANLGQVVE